MISMKQRKVKVPYEGYRLPPSSEQQPAYGRRYE